MIYPFVNGNIVDYEIAKTAEDFLSKVEVAPYREENIVMEFSRPTEPTEAMQREYPQLWEDISNYNSGIYRENQADLTGQSAYEANSFVLEDYGLPDEVFGVISIPALELEMPIYLGASPKHMADGAAVLSETSIPIGGINSNAVIAGHRGWNGASYFLHVPNLQIGDSVTITNLWDVLSYEVIRTEIIDPNDYEKILIQEGKDMITLLTCHPPASGGKQRILVFCERRIR